MKNKIVKVFLGSIMTLCLQQSTLAETQTLQCFDDTYHHDPTLSLQLTIEIENGIWKKTSVTNVVGTNALLAKVDKFSMDCTNDKETLENITSFYGIDRKGEGNALTYCSTTKVLGFTSFPLFAIMYAHAYSTNDNIYARVQVSEYFTLTYEFKCQ